MKCPKCKFPTGVVITVPDGSVVWRKRVCRKCEFVFETSEMEDSPLGTTVVQMKEQWKKSKNV